MITVQHLLGHAKIPMTARYAHSPDNARIAAVKRLDALFESQRVPKQSPEFNEGDAVAGHKSQHESTLGP